MPTNDTIDNRDGKLIDHIRRILPGCQSAKFAVGYFFLSGLEAVADQLGNVEELRLLVGNTSSCEAWPAAETFQWPDHFTTVLTGFQLRAVRYAVIDPGSRSRSQT